MSTGQLTLPYRPSVHLKGSRATPLRRGGSTPADHLIVAFDFTALSPALALARQLRGLVPIIKIGSSLFTACGPTVIERIRSMGFGVMLDLKFFDIPSTVELSCRAAVHHQVAMLTVHASGEPAMLEAAVHGVRDEAKKLGVSRPLILGVTVLTSVGSDSAASVKKIVLSLAERAAASGCDGIVAAAQETVALRQRFGDRFYIVCPGIRPAQADADSSIRPASSLPARQVSPRGRAARMGSRDDQRRVCTPGEALASGASALVIGRPITAARDPRTVVEQILREMEVDRGC